MNNCPHLLTNLQNQKCNCGSNSKTCDLGPLRSKTALFPKAMRAEVGQLDVNFREIPTTAYIWLCLLQKITRHIQTSTQEKPIKLSLAAFTPSDNDLSQTSRTLLDFLPSELRNWDYSLLDH